MSLTALLEVCHGYGRGLRDLVNRYNPNVSTNNFPVILGRDGTGGGGRQAGDKLTVVPLQASCPSWAPRSPTSAWGTACGSWCPTVSRCGSAEPRSRSLFLTGYMQGSLAPWLVLDQALVRPLPAPLSFEGGATLPYVGMVAWDMLVTLGDIGPSTAAGDCILLVLVSTS